MWMLAFGYASLYGLIFVVIVVKALKVHDIVRFYDHVSNSLAKLRIA